MRTLEGTVLLAGLVLALAPFAQAQDSDPSVNESDFDTSSPPYDEQYLDEEEPSGADASASSGDAAAESDPTVSEGDFDVSMPADDTSYLDDAEAQYVSEDAGATSAGSDTPGPGLLAGLAALGLAALALRRR